MPKPEVKSQLVSVDTSGRVWAGGGMRSGDHRIRINPDGTWQFVDGEGREILHWDLELKVGDRVESPGWGHTYSVVAVAPTAREPYVVVNHRTNSKFPISRRIENWLRVEPKSDLQPGELIHSARAGGTFRVSTVNEQRQVVHLEDFQGRRWPFDLDYVRSHFRRFGEVSE